MHTILKTGDLLTLKMQVSDDEGALTRTFYSPAHKRAAEMVRPRAGHAPSACMHHRLVLC